MIMGKKEILRRRNKRERTRIRKRIRGRINNSNKPVVYKGKNVLDLETEELLDFINGNSNNNNEKSMNSPQSGKEIQESKETSHDDKEMNETDFNETLKRIEGVHEPGPKSN